jgi:hypothetical protein
VSTAPEAASAFGVRAYQPSDISFIGTTFDWSYRQHGHTHGVRDLFDALIGKPFRQLVEASDDETRDPVRLISTTVLYPHAEPTEIAGYAVTSPRHSALVYILTKNAYARCGVATALLGAAPRKSVTVGPMMTSPVLLHCFSTANFAALTRATQTQCRYSPFLFPRLLWELKEESRG